VAQNEKRELPVLNAGGASRREVLQGLFAGVGASVAWPAAAHTHFPEPVVAAAQAKARSADWKAEFLDPHQLATVTALCARIVPGSEKAHTDRFIDSLLAVDSRERAGRFMNALGAIEGASLSRFQRPFKALSEAQQVELLTAAATAEPGRKDWIWKPGELVKQPERGPETLTLRDHFDTIKTWVVDGYYSSEAGMKELGSTGQMFWAEFPDCKHPEHT
jgi:hypothetical protein